MKWAVTLLALSCFVPVSAQNLNFIHYNSNNSRLPHDVVYSVFQSSQGYLWICTDDGLVRFDGLQMKPYEKGLASRYTIAMDEDDNQLWLATWRGGIHRLQEDSLIPMKSDFVDAINTNKLLVHQGTFIAHSFSDYSLLRLDSTSNILKLSTLEETPNGQSVFSPRDASYSHFLKLRNGKLIVYSKSGVIEVDKRKSRKVSSKTWNLLQESADGRLYGLLGSELFELDASFHVIRLVYKISETLIKPETIGFVHVLNTGTLCVGTRPLQGNPNYFLINPKTGRAIDLVAGVKTNSPISNVYADREGSLWLCTDGDGLYHVFDAQFQVLGSQVLTLNPHATDIVYSPATKELLIGTKKGVLALQYPLAPIPKSKVIIENFFTNHFFVDEEQIGFCNKGIPIRQSFFYDQQGLKESEFYEVLHTRTYRIEVSHFYNYRIYSKTTNTYFKGDSAAKPLAMIDFAEDDKKQLWIAAENELALFNWESGWKKIPFWKGGIIHALLFEPGKGIWVGSATGLYLLTEEGVLSHWSEKEGLHNSHINCLLLQAGYGLWIGTQNGLYQLDTKNKLRLFKKRNGLIADDVLSFAALPDGYLAVGSSKGLTFFDPQVPTQIQQLPTLLVDEIKIDGIAVSQLGNSFEVGFKGTFEINVNSITFLYPELLVFEYRLNPSDPWISTKNRSIILTRLEPGNYTLALRVRKFDAGYSKEVNLSLHVSEPWWLSTYFYAGIALTLLVLGALIFYSRLEKQRKSLLLREELADLKLKSVLTQLNPHFVSNSLNAIQYYILNRDEQQANHYLSKFASLTRLILESSRHRFIPLQSEVEILELYLGLEKLRFENRFDFSIHVDHELALKTYYLPGIVVQPFAENSINHGLLYLHPSVRGQLHIAFLKDNDSLLIRIDDNGIGRKKSRELAEKQGKKRTSLGESIVEEIRQSVNELPGCSMQLLVIDKVLEDGTSSGTCVEIRLKIDDRIAEQEHFTPTEKNLI